MLLLRRLFRGFSGAIFILTAFMLLILPSRYHVVLVIFVVLSGILFVGIFHLNRLLPEKTLSRGDLMTNNAGPSPRSNRNIFVIRGIVLIVISVLFAALKVFNIGNVSVISAKIIAIPVLLILFSGIWYVILSVWHE
jgi:hypothetical protein